MKASDKTEFFMRHNITEFDGQPDVDAWNLHDMKHVLVYATRYWHSPNEKYSYQIGWANDPKWIKGFTVNFNPPDHLWYYFMGEWEKDVENNLKAISIGDIDTKEEALNMIIEHWLFNKEVLLNG